MHRQTGRLPRELAELPPFPDEVHYIWAWYQEVRGDEPLSFTELASWASLTSAQPSPAEVEALRTLDLIYWSSLDE